MQKSVENVRKVLTKAKAAVEETMSLEEMAEWDRMLSHVCPKSSDLEGDDWQDIQDMLFEWNWFCITIRRRVFEAEEKRVGP